jgi:BirA family biotin operon repressor/biotin-[acetyl-CoA-carboxylase] ligase
VSPTSTPLTSAALKKGLEAKRFGSKVYTFETIDSTNNCARALAGCWAAEGTLVLAEHQTAGKGRLGRQWLANPGENLTFSLVLRPTIGPEVVNLLPLYAAVALAETIEQTCGTKVDCKWPNDLLIGGKKAAGILLEGSVTNEAVDFVVLGVGLNVNQTSFPPEFQDRATSLRLHTGREFDRTELLQTMLLSLEKRYDGWMKNRFRDVLPSWLAKTSMINKEVTVSVDGSTLTGTVSGMTPDGALILQTNGTEMILFAGDVTIVDH